MKRMYLIVILFGGAVALLPAQDPDIEQDTLPAAHSLEEIWRSSEQEGEMPVRRRRAGTGIKRVSAPKGSFRIGCVCMDDSYSPARTIGACSGHGGVRFWLYRTREGDTVRVQTGRHERHPEALDADEMSAIAQKRAEKTETLKRSLAPQPYGPVTIIPGADNDDMTGGGWYWPAPLTAAILGVAAFVLLRMLLRWINANEKLIRYALRHFVRHRKRPLARKNRKTPRKTRL